MFLLLKNKRLPYLKYTFGFDFDHIAAVGESLTKSDCPWQNMTSCQFFKWQISAILDFSGPMMGSLKSPCNFL